MKEGNYGTAKLSEKLFHSAALGPEYWSFTLLHAVYLKNRLPHSATGATPYLTYTGNRPSAKELRIFGCHIISKQPGKRPTKLDSHTCTGRFLGYTATDKNVYFRDDQTHRIKITTYCTFDEGGMTVPPAEQPPSAKALQLHGYKTQQERESEPESEDLAELNIQLLSSDAKIPARGTANSAGYDVFSPIETTIPPSHRILIPLDIAANPPAGTYIQVASRSGLSAKHLVDTQAGIIDTDYTGNITVVLHNYGNNAYQIKKGDRIAQLLVLPIHHPTMKITSKLADTPRNEQGFGSTGMAAIVRSAKAPPTAVTEAAPAVPDLPFDIFMSLDPFDTIQHINIPIKGDHPTLGLNLTPCPYRNRLRLIDMTPGTPGSRIPKWRSILRNSYLTSIQDTQTESIEDCHQAINQAKQTGTIKLKCSFAVDKSYGIHPHEGKPQLYFDQLNTIAKHPRDIKPIVRQLNPPSTQNNPEPT
jgi:dUTP pyrophosphatase